MTDTTKPQNFYSEEMVLYFGKRNSVFKSYEFMVTSELERKKVEELVNNAKKENGGGNININIGKTLIKGSQIRYYNFTTEGKLYQYHPFMGTIFAIEEPIQNIDWKIENEIKKIGDYTCQKAIGKSFGRIYEAWFTTDLPYHFGPRKLHGLPGLILEAHDVKNQIIYTFERIDMIPDNTENIILPGNAVVTNKKEFDRAEDAYYKNPDISNKTEGGISVSMVRTSDGQPYRPKKPKAAQNPIELSAE